MKKAPFRTIKTRGAAAKKGAPVSAGTAPSLSGEPGEPRESNEIKLKLLRLMWAARLNDEAEQALKRRGQGQFLMSCEGHEALAGVALAMKPGDWLHPHYRDRAILLGRGVTHEEFFLDYFSKSLSSSGGRQMPQHYSNRQHRVVSLSSPVGTNFLQAVGMAMSLKARGVPEVVVACAGDATTRQGESFEAIIQAGVDKLPVVFLIEDNGWGISTPTHGKTFWTLPNGLSFDGETHSFLDCRAEVIDGLDPVTVYRAASRAVERARAGQGASCLIARVERLKSHSSSDDQRLYRKAEDLEKIQAKDPVAAFSERCLREQVLSAAELEAMRAQLKREIDGAAQRARIAPDPDPATVKDSAFAPLPAGLPRIEAHLPAPKPKSEGGLTMAQAIAAVLEDEMRANSRLMVYGEDIEDPKGDVFGTTRGLSQQFPGQVRNSPLAEATIVGTSVGRALMGDLPIASIQFIDFMGPALNQLLNEAVTLHWRSRGEWNCPMVVTAPYGGYLPGLGPWHSQTNEGFYAHVPGLHVVIPSNPADAAGLLRFALRCNRPVLYLYPKALLHGADDTVAAPSPECIIPFGQAKILREGRGATVVTWGNGAALCRAVGRRAAEEGIDAEIIDLRTLTPWDAETVKKSVVKTGRLLVVHEDGKTCGFGGEIIAEVLSACFEYLRAAPVRIAKPDEHIPFQYDLELALLPSEADVLDALRALCRQDAHAACRASAAPGVPALAPVASVAPAAPVPDARSSGSQRVPVTAPKFSPTDEDAVLVRYLVKAGDDVAVGTPLAELEANKGSFEVDSPHAGKVLEFHVTPGTRIRVEKDPLLTLEAAGVILPDAPPAERPSAREPASEAAPASAPVPELRELRLTPCQLQVGQVALKSQREIPMAGMDLEADATELVRLRQELAARIEPKWGVRPTHTHLLLWALVRAMASEAHAGFRGTLAPRGDRLLIGEDVNAGFAAAGPQGDLYLPVVKHASRLSFVQLVRRVRELTEAVRAGKIDSADLQGATVSLTNLGAFESAIGTPFVLPGQVAMLAAGAITERPRVVRQHGVALIEIRQVLNLKLVFDHRPFNGSHAASFLRTIRDELERLSVQALIE